MRQFRSITITSISFTAIAAVMWVLAIAWGAAHVYMTALPLDRSGAIAATGLAGIWWGVLMLLRADRDKSILIRTLAAQPLSRPGDRPLRPTRPLPVHRALWRVSPQRPR